MQPLDHIQNLQQAMIDGGRKAFQTVPVVLQRIIEDRLWSERVDRNGKPFQSFEAFATHILWHGLESSIDDLLIYCRKRPDVQALIRGEVGAITAQVHDDKGRFTRSDIVTTGRGNSPTYALKRLRRDRPDLFQRVVSGELSANAAAVEAGFRRQTFTCPSNIEGAATAIVRRFGKDGAASLVNALSKRIEAT